MPTMTIIDRYILGRVIRPVAMALLVAFVVLLIERMLHLISLIFGASGPLKIALLFIGYLVPRYLAAAVPVSLLLGIVFAFTALRRDGEVDALRATGSSLFRQTRPLLAAAVLVAAIQAAVLGFLNPYSRYAYEALLFDLRNTATQALIQTGVFSRIDDTTFLVQGVQPDGSGFASVFIYEGDPEGRTSAIAANGGSLVRAEGGSAPVLRLFNGVQITEDRRPEADTNVSVLRFRELRKPLNKENRVLFRPRGSHEREMTIVELWRERDTPPQGIRSSDLIAEAHGRIVRVLSNLFLPLLGVWLAFGRPRSERFYGVAASVLIVVVYDQILDFGENAVEAGKISPFVGLWLPFLTACLLSVLLFARADLTVPRGGAALRPLRWLPRMLRGREA
jgi:lipopolysaccharide export system permease protein